MFPSTTATTHTLANGLTVILAPDHTAPVISTQIWVETGSIHEGDQMGAGLSHLLEHMVFKGTASFSGEELSQTILAAGGQWNAYTSFDRTVYYIDGPADSADTFLKALLEMVFKPAFPIDEFEKEKGVIRREIDMGLDDPDHRASRLLFSTALDQDGRCQPVIGHLELFNLVTYEDMLSYHRSRYTTENAFVSIAGDFDPAAMIQRLDSLCTDIPRSFTKTPLVRYQPPQLGMRVQRDHFAVPVSKLSLSWQSPSLEHPDAPALDLLASILGAGRSSRLYTKLREERSLCLHISASSWNTAGAPGIFSISAEVATDQRDSLQAAIIELVQALPNDALDAELAKAKRMCLMSQFKTLTTASGRASDLASNWHETRNLNFTKDYLTKIEAVTEAEVKDVCRRYLCSDQTLTVTSLDPESSSSATSTTAESTHAREIHSHTLSNGLQLHLCRDPRLPTVAIQGAALGGLAAEPPHHAGISTLLSTMLRKGTTSRSAADIASTLDSLGATLGFSSGNNSAAIAASCLSTDLEVVMDILGDTLTNPALPDQYLDFERTTQITAIKEDDEDPLTLAFRHLRSSLFAGEGYGLNQLGSETTLQAIDRDALLAHHTKTFSAANISLSIFGDIDLETTLQIAEKSLGKIPTGTRHVAPTQPIADPTQLHLQLDKQQAVLTLGYLGAAFNSPDIPALLLLHTWFSDMAGPLFTRIREELGLAYYCGATQFHGHHTGLFAFYLGTSPDQLDLAKNELIATIDTISKSGMDATTLESVKNSWLAKDALTNQSKSSMARICAIDTLLGYSTNHHRELIDQIKAVTPTDTQRIAHTYFSTPPHTLVTVTNPASA